MIQILQSLLLRGAFVANAHKFIEENGALLLSFQLICLVLTDLALHKVSHLRQFSLTLRLQALNEVGHLNVLILGDAEFLAKFDSHLISALLVILNNAELRMDI